jgi:hypothetical protein
MSSSKKKTRKEVWRKSKAKEHLRLAILSGVVTASMSPEHVFTMCAEYQKFELSNFKVNLKNLRAKIEKDKERMRRDCEAYGHDRALLKGVYAQNIIPWHRSTARKLLIEDISNGKNKTMKPKELYLTREEYKTMDLKTFRNRIYQEVDRELKIESRKRFGKKKMRSNGHFE